MKKSVPTETAAAKSDGVLPRTLGVRPLKYTQGETEIEFAGVYGGRNGEVWCATFFDKDEAQSWILACNHFGQAVKGMVTDVPRIVGGEPVKSRD